jgi:hypothetical protein
MQIEEQAANGQQHLGVLIRYPSFCVWCAQPVEPRWAAPGGAHGRHPLNRGGKNNAGYVCGSACSPLDGKQVVAHMSCFKENRDRVQHALEHGSLGDAAPRQPEARGASPATGIGALVASGAAGPSTWPRPAHMRGGRKYAPRVPSQQAPQQQEQQQRQQPQGQLRYEPYGGNRAAPLPRQAQAQARPSSGGAFPGFDRCREAGIASVSHIFQQWPSTTLADLFRTGMTIDDLCEMYGPRGSSGGTLLCSLLGRHGTYRDVMQAGSTRNWLNQVSPLDATRLPFTKRDWRALGVSYPQDVGLTRQQWNNLPD